ncbi:MAG: DUF4097 family beta strand repeat-containing protein [Candidatus Aminicenantales bacterium]
MTRLSRTFNRTAWLAAVVLFAAGAVFGAKADSIVRTFDVGPGGKLVLATDIGSIEVRGIEAPVVTVEVAREVRAGNTGKTRGNFKLDFDSGGNDVYVTGEYKRRGLGGLFDRIRNRLKVRFIISVPSSYNLDLKTSGGSITIADIRGGVSGRTSGGGLRFERIVGKVDGRTSGGGIRIDAVEGDIDARTSGGSIGIEDVSGRISARTSGGGIHLARVVGDADVRTSGGGITAEEIRGALQADTSGGSITASFSAPPPSACRLSTSGGGISVALPENAAADVDARTSGGSVSTEFPVTVQGKLARNSLRASINGGGPELLLRTSGGGIRIRRLPASQ